MPLQADLIDFSLSQIVFLISYFKKSGKLEVKASPTSGEIYFEEGNAVHAQCGELKGAEAVYNLFLEIEGSVKFLPRERTSERTITEGADKLLQEGDRRRLEMSEILKAIPSLDTVFVRTAQAPDETAIRLRKSDWSILALVDGKRPTKTIIESSKMGMLEALKTINWLLSKNLIIDPLETEKLLQSKVRMINLMFEEFGEKGTGVAPYRDLVEKNFPPLDRSGRLAKYVQITPNMLQIVSGAKRDITKEEVNEVFDRLIDILHKKGISDFGPILGKHKYQSVLSKMK
ncbi:MAG: DUF4388 domain-containing protein [Candidatus Edwardsbacteria bacterium]